MPLNFSLTGRASIAALLWALSGLAQPKKSLPSFGFAMRTVLPSFLREATRVCVVAQHLLGRATPRAAIALFYRSHA